MRPSENRWISKWFFNGLFCNGLFIGWIISIFLVLWPLSQTFSQYLSNTHNLFYSIFLNIFSNGDSQIHRSNIPFEALWLKIYGFYGRFLMLGKANLLHLVFLFTVLAFARAIWDKNKPARKNYLFAGYLFLIGFVMDLLSSLRNTPNFYDYYMIYSMVFYYTAFAIFIYLEFNRIDRTMIVRRLICLALILCFIFNAFTTIRTHELWRPTRGISDQTPLFEYNFASALGFWQIVEESLRKETVKYDYVRTFDAKIEVPVTRQEKSLELMREGLMYSKMSLKDIRNISLAINSFRQSLTQDPNNIVAYITLARLYVSLSAYKDALLILRAALIVDPHNQTLYDQIIDCYRALGDKGLMRYYIYEKSVQTD
ncbi:MAG: hypothetical protein HQL27_07495 [Candidatus Omnitrophica bacterium]|nr:hypothetical protein [Candidatus Omnitrophota bacterium]